MKRTKLQLVAFLLLIVIGSGYQNKGREIKQIETEKSLLKTTELIKQTLQNNFKDFELHSEFSRYSKIMYTIYYHNNFNPLWSTGFSKNDKAMMFHDYLKDLRYFGLPDKAFNIGILNRESAHLESDIKFKELVQHRVYYDLIMTSDLITSVMAIDKGLIFTSEYHDDSVSTELQTEFFLRFVHCIQSDNISEEILSYQPQNIEYKKLQAGGQDYIKKYERIHHKLCNLDSASAIKENILVEAALHLKILDILNDTITIRNIVRALDQKYGVDNPTWSEICQMIDQEYLIKFFKIAINLERLRTQSEFTTRYAFVNIPSYSMQVVSNDQIEKKFRVIVGTPDSPTPLISSKIERIVTSPQWNVPKSIANNEMLYYLKRDSSYLQRKGYTIVDKKRNEVDYNEIEWETINSKNFNYYIQQQPGAFNALGLVKFLFPNEHYVYLHDTPSKSLFNKSQRAYSHGCVRLENPAEFAEYLLQKDGNSLDKQVKSLMRNKITKEVTLKEPFDIFIRYLTCEGDENRDIAFHEDIYNQDNELIMKLFN